MDDKDITLNEWVKFDEETGLKVSTQSEIFEDLKSILKSSFGADFVIQEGSDMFSFLDSLATSLANSGGSYKKIYDAIDFISASGITLDNAVSLAGIVRKGLVRSSVDITISNTDAISKTLYAPIRIQDSRGGNWFCDDDIIMPEDGSDVIKTFQASDGNIEKPYNLSIKSYNGTEAPETGNTWRILTTVPSGISFQNKNDSIYGQEKEADAQLRYRYYTAIHNQSLGTVEGLEAKLLNANTLNLEEIGATQLVRPLNYVHVYQNNTANEDENKVAGHSIWVIVDGYSEWNIEESPNSTNDPDDITIAKIIKNYKSLGAGTSSGSSKPHTDIQPRGAITYKFEEDGIEKEIKFSRVELLDCNVKLTLTWKSGVSDDDKATIITLIKNSIRDYINNLNIGDDVLYSGVSSAIYKVYTENNYLDYLFDINTLAIGSTPNPTGTRLGVAIYQKANTTTDLIVVE